MAKLLIFDDNPDYGGHQIMAAYAIEGLLEHSDWDLLGLVHGGNTKNRNRWEQIRAASVDWAQRFQIENSPTESVKFNAVRRYWKPQARRQLKARIDAFAPDAILVIQGNIEQGSALFTLIPQLSCPVVSYIPVPHRHAEMGAKLGALRDLTCQHLYGQPDGFITISETLADMLKRYGAHGRIEVVPNGIDLQRFESKGTRAEACQQYEIPESGFHWAQIGRIEFKQKGQDLTLKHFAQRQQNHPDEHLIFVGSGPDAEALLTAMQGIPQVYHIPWVDEVGRVFPALDALILPSRYEGVPLVMLEALANGIPVMASDRDGMIDWLPAEWRFDRQDGKAFVKSMDLLRSTGPEWKSSLQERVFETCSLPVFKKVFHSALGTWL